MKIVEAARMIENTGNVITEIIFGRRFFGESATADTAVTKPTMNTKKKTAKKNFVADASITP